MITRIITVINNGSFIHNTIYIGSMVRQHCAYDAQHHVEHIQFKPFCWARMRIFCNYLLHVPVSRNPRALPFYKIFSTFPYLLVALYRCQSNNRQWIIQTVPANNKGIQVLSNNLMKYQRSRQYHHHPQKKSIGIESPPIPFQHIGCNIAAIQSPIRSIAIRCLHPLQKTQELLLSPLLLHPPDNSSQ